MRAFPIKPFLIGVFAAYFMNNVNHSLFLLLNASDNAAPICLGLANLFAVYAIAVLPLKLVIDWLWGTSDDRAVCLAVFGAVLLAIAVNQGIGTFLYLPRPAQAGIGHIFLNHVPDSSFPSDHATVLFAAASAYAFAKRSRAAIAMALIGVVVSWARIYLGVHFPFDIAGAALVGLLVAGAVHWTMKATGIRLTTSAEAVYRRLFSQIIALGWIKA